jgi:hypothetical protein
MVNMASYLAHRFAPLMQRNYWVVYVHFHFCQGKKIKFYGVNHLSHIPIRINTRSRGGAKNVERGRRVYQGGISALLWDLEIRLVEGII